MSEKARIIICFETSPKIVSDGRKKIVLRTFGRSIAQPGGELAVTISWDGTAQVVALIRVPSSDLSQIEREFSAVRATLTEHGLL